MAEYTSFDPHVEVLGRVLLSWLHGTEGEIAGALAAHGIEDVQPDRWYPLQDALDALKEFGQSANLVSMGQHIIEHAIFPEDQMTDLVTALTAIDQAYHMNHRNGEIGSYRAEVIGDQHITIVAENPYPSDFDYGLIWAIATRFLPPRSDLVLELDLSAPTRQQGADSCTYHITW